MSGSGAKDERNFEAEVRKLEMLDLDGLREEWRRRYGVPPALRSEPILRMMLAWRIQADALGGLDADTKRRLANTGSPLAAGSELGEGAVLSRKWKGRTVEVVVREGGFEWNGERYKSLSAAALAITGSRWNGPRFFGLREGA